MNIKKQPVTPENDGHTLDFSVNVGNSDPATQQRPDEVTIGLTQGPHARDTAKEDAVGAGDTIEQTPLPGKGEVPSSPGLDETMAPISTAVDDTVAPNSPSAPSSPSAKPSAGVRPKTLSSAARRTSMIGRTIGDYRFDAELGRGGMGVVYRAHHLKLRRDVAIKMILGAASRDRQTLSRFETEARAVAGLKHVNVVQLYEFGQFDESPFFALEFVDGGTLADKTKDLPLDPREAARIVECLARAMQAAHDLGVLHRDLKPANVLLTSDGVPKISDFGLAKELVDGDHEQTKTGTVMGTPSFMSPEQAMGQISALTGATDQYSLGAILYACLSGRPPFMSATTIDTITQVVHKEPVPPRQLSNAIPTDLETICLKTLQKDKHKRYANCVELADDLKRFLNGEPIAARPISKLERSWRWCKRNPRVAVPSGLALLFILATAGISSWAWAATSAQAAVIAQQRDHVKAERDEAQRQRDEAQRQRIIATEQKAAAEDNERIAQKQAQLALQNIQFVITDVDKLLREQPGMSDVRISILETVSKKWDELNLEMAGGVRGEAIPTFMAARQLMAIAFRDLDRLQLAADEFSKLEEMARERIAVKGRNDATRLNLSKILIASSPLARRLEVGPKKGIEQLKEAAELCEEIIRDPRPQEGSPSNNEVLLVLAAAAQNLGVEYLRDGRLAETEEAFSRALDANSKVLENVRGTPAFAELDDEAKDKHTGELQLQLDKSRFGVAYIRLRLGRTEEAMPLYQQGIASRREALERQPTSLNLKNELAGYLRLYGKSLVWLSRYDEADPVLPEAVDMADAVWQADPERVDLKRGLSDALFTLGTLRDLQGRNQEALARFERCRLLRKELYDASPDEKNAINLMLAEARVGNADRTKELSDQLGQGTATNGELHLERARSLAQISELAEGEPQDKLQTEALDALERAVAEGYSDPFRIEVEDELSSLRDTDRFAAILKRLREN